ncbi:hypothetical protein [Kitasatospora sp. NPDC097691]|uniref:hypothetical protein n=1 Tax=Kitasatospora sp. NPDC097691 TaxID=3157231 RepID=UPI0033166971
MLGCTGSVVPALQDGDLTLTVPRIIAEYLDERHPHPPLNPAYPIARARTRSLADRIESMSYPLAWSIEGRQPDADTCRRQLHQELLRQGRHREAAFTIGREIRRSFRSYWPSSLK